MNNQGKTQQWESRYFLSIIAGCFALWCNQGCSTEPAQPLPGEVEQLRAGFQHPPLEARPKALWPWVNGNFSLSRITEEMEEAKAKGMGGFDIWDVGSNMNQGGNMPDGPAFLSDESLQAIAHAVREGDRLGLELGLITSSSWNAGGAWVAPEHGAMGLYRADTVIRGPLTFEGTLPFPQRPSRYERRPVIFHNDPETGLPVFYKDVATVAHPLSTDSLIGQVPVLLAEKMDARGRLHWQVPEGTWRIVRYVCAPSGQPLMIPSPKSNGLMLDHFSREAQKANMQYIFDRLTEVLGDLKNRSLKYLYTDSYEVNTAIWTPALAEAFQKRYGYGMEAYLPVLDGFTVENSEVSERFLFDFHKLLSDLIIDNHYAYGRELAGQYGLGYYAEAGGPGQPIHNVPFEDLRALGALTVPRGEFWNRHPQLELLQIVKGIASAAHIYNQVFVEAEAFTSVWLWQEGPDELKPLADRAMTEGLNRFVYHTFPHTTPEAGNPGWVYNFGTLIHTTRTWWPLSAGFHHYLARQSYLLQQGNFVGDVAFYYGHQAPNFVPPKHVPETLGFGYDYDVVNSEAILTKMTVKNGRIFLPHGQFYEVLVLPNGVRMDPDVLEKLAAMVREGATIIGPKPQRSHSLQNWQQNDARVQNLADELWGRTDDPLATGQLYGKGKVVWGKTVREVLLEKGVNPDLTWVDGPASQPIDFIHRTTPAAEIYFMRNTAETPQSGIFRFRVPEGYYPEIWDADLGKMYPVPYYSAGKEGIALPVYLGAYGALNVVFLKGTPPNGRKPLAESSLQALAGKWKSAPFMYTPDGLSLFRGEAVAEENTKIPASQRIDGPWEVRFPHGQGAPTTTEFPALISWDASADDAIRHFSGIASYRKSFALAQSPESQQQRLFLDLGEVKEVARVYLNGHELPLAWHRPYRLDITGYARAGQNYLVIDVANTLNNRLAGDAKRPQAYRALQSNVARLPNAWMFPFAEAPLLPSGLLGPVQLQWAVTLME